MSNRAKGVNLQDKINFFSYKYFKNSRLYRLLIGTSDFYAFTAEIFKAVKHIKGDQLSSFVVVIVNQIKFTGAKALPLLAIIAVTLGGSTIIQAVTLLPKFGANDFIGNILNLVIIREIGPLITAIIILTRSGSAISAEFATQKLHGEIEAIKLMGIDPFILMVFPRIIGGLVATTLLVVYFDFIAIVGGFFVSRLVTDFPFSTFMKIVLNSLSMADILSTAVKCVSYGFLIPLICSYFGLQPKTLYEIPIYVSKAVVRSLFTIFLLNGFISVLFYL